MFQSKLLFVGMVVLLAACSEDKKDEVMVYEYEVNGCNTGRHEASSKTAYCENLKNHSLNKNCAYSLRKETFDKECSSIGIAWENPGSGSGSSSGGQTGGSLPDPGLSYLSCVTRVVSDGLVLHQGGQSMKFALPIYKDKEVYSGQGVHVRYLLISNGSTGTRIALQLLKDTGNLIQEDEFVWDEKNVANYGFKKLTSGLLVVSAACEISRTE